jgi:hypothetical protein
MVLYRKKPLLVDAIHWTGENSQDVLNFLEGLPHIAYRHTRDLMALTIYTTEGTRRVDVGDFIIKDVNDELYSYNSKIFARDYEIAVEEKD